MRKVLAFLLAPAAGLAVFALVLSSPELQVARGDAGLHLQGVPTAGLLLAYLLVLLLSVPVFQEVRAGFGWTGLTTAVAAGVVYVLAFLVLGYTEMGSGRFLAGWPEALGLFSASLVHAAVFLSFRPGEKRYYFFP